MSAAIELSSDCPVCSYNEWDLLEEVIVGDVSSAIVPEWDAIDFAAHSKADYKTWYETQRQRMPADHIEAATKEVNELVRILEAEGVRVRRPDPIPHEKSYASPDWECSAGFNTANPRDLLMVVGDQIIETSTPRRNRVYETNAYRSLLNEYFKGGARWVSAPRPRLQDELYRTDMQADHHDSVPCLEPNEKLEIPLNEIEPVFEAADFMRCGRDIFYHKSFVTNEMGVTWLKRHLGETYRFHEIDTRCRRPVHIDTTFIPLAPGKAIANPDYAPYLPEILKKWDILYPPTPISKSPKSPYQFGSHWLSINLFSLDEERVFVDAQQEPMLRKLRDWGFKPIALPFQNYYPFAGGLHCSTLDIRRKGTLESYF